MKIHYELTWSLYVSKQSTWKKLRAEKLVVSIKRQQKSNFNEELVRKSIFKFKIDIENISFVFKSMLRILIFGLIPLVPEVLLMLMKRINLVN